MVYVFGINIPILELLVVFSVVVVAYLVLLEIEFRQLRKISKKFKIEEISLSEEIKALHYTVGLIKNKVGAASPTGPVTIHPEFQSRPVSNELVSDESEQKLAPEELKEVIQAENL